MAALTLADRPTALPTAVSAALVGRRGAPPVKPPSPDMSVLSDSERQHLMTVLQLLLVESEKELRLIRSTEEELREEEAVFPDFYVICDGCLQIERCVELPHMANGGRLLLCADCVVSFLSGTWFNGVKISDTINVCSELMQLAAASAASAGNTTDKISLGTPKLFELASHEAVLKDEEEALPSMAAHGQPAADKAKGNVNISPDESDEEGEVEKSTTSNKFAVTRGADGDATTPTNEKGVGLDDKPDRQGKSTPVDVPVCEHASHMHHRQQRNSASSTSDFPVSVTSTPSSFPEGPGLSEDIFSPVGEGRTEYSRFLGPGQLTGDEPVGELEMRVRVGAESTTGQSGLIIDVLQGHNFKHWGGMTGKPSFQIYIKCYLMSGSKVKAKLKTHSVPPSAQPQFYDQLISVMDKKVLEKLDSVKVQVWEHHRALTKNFAVGTATIALSEIRLEDDAFGRYPIFLPRRAGPTTPQADSPPSSFTRSPSGRFDLRTSFRRLGGKRSSKRRSMSEAPNNADISIRETTAD